MLDTLNELLAGAIKLGNMREWGVIAFLLITGLYTSIMTRRDRNKVRKEELERELRIDDLLKTRHEQFRDVFTKATNVISDNKAAMLGFTMRLEDLDDRVEALDKRCDDRQQKCRTDSERRRRGQP